MAFLAWFDPDKKIPTHQKVQDACERYSEKMGSAPVLCLTSHVDALALAETVLPVDVRGVTYVQRNTFYIGCEETA